MTKQNNRMQIDSLQLTMPRARRRHFYNLRYSGYVTLLESGSDKTKMAEENDGSLLFTQPREQSSCLAARKVLRILAIYSFISLYSTSIEILFVSWKHFIRSPFQLHGKCARRSDGRGIYYLFACVFKYIYLIIYFKKKEGSKRGVQKGGSTFCLHPAGLGKTYLT